MIAKQARDQCRVHGMAGPVGNNISENLFTQQREIANQIQNFVTNKFIRKS